MSERHTIEDVETCLNEGRILICATVDGVSVIVGLEQKPVFIQQGYVGSAQWTDPDPHLIDLSAAGIEGYSGTVDSTTFIESPALALLVSTVAAGYVDIGPVDFDVFVELAEEDSADVLAEVERVMVLG